MSKKITTLGYKAGNVVCGKFFDLQHVMTFKEMANYYGYEDDKADNEALVEAFNGAGFEFVGCVKVKDGLDEVEEATGLMGGYLVRAVNARGRYKLFVAHDVWDEARGMGMTRAYRFNVFTRGSFEYEEAQKAYRRATRK